MKIEYEDSFYCHFMSYGIFKLIYKLSMRMHLHVTNKLLEKPIASVARNLYIFECLYLVTGCDIDHQCITWKKVNVCFCAGEWITAQKKNTEINSF